MAIVIGEATVRFDYAVATRNQTECLTRMAGPVYVWRLTRRRPKKTRAAKKEKG